MHKFSIPIEPGKPFMFLLFALILFISILPVMAYSTNADLYDRIDQELVIDLTDDAQTGSVDQTKIDNLRADVHELINSYLRGRHDVPVSPAPALLVTIEADLLVHKLYSRRANYEVPDTVLQLKHDAVKQLMDIAKGVIQLDSQPDVGEAKIVSNKTSASRIFDDDTLNSF